MLLVRATHGVPILTRPVGRMLRRVAVPVASGICSNPHPARRPDAAQASSRYPWLLEFQSSPGP